ncbi:MAG: fasciclin domain-containing protein [Winogradskyella sp.]|uniref:fasciclin domain-containing protein n=1 Tax=Winogradskyella sp. TaxID=1883156 RepID=UPI0025D1DAA3|nr:fasciclin domain-containing protein [Winogradskyella sp.]NRB58792.1 fasciclin domain-containing protein [Winogradskyella sp.]
MKIISKTFKLLTVFLLVLGVTGCSDDDDNNGPGVQATTVVDIAAANGLTSLAAALQATDLVTTLQGAGPFTVFAPTNDAFDTLLNDTGLDLNNLTDAQEDLVRNILLNHVIIGPEIMSSDLVNAGDGYAKTAAVGPNGENLSLYFNTSNGAVINGQSNIDLNNVDITATNGVVHIVDTVIALPTIGTFATSNPALSTLVAALSYADDSGAGTVPYINTVLDDTAGPFTVFAPVNAAFTDPTNGVLAELGLSGFGEGEGQLNGATTDAVLLLHLVSANVQSDQLASGTVTTLGGDITADATNFTLTDSNDRVSNIVTSLVDIQGMNGVVHVIDKVILPGL